MIRTFLAQVALLVTLPCAALAANPSETVEKFHATLAENMAQAAKLKCEGRTERLGPAVDVTYDLPFIAERALRKHWKTLGEPERSAFIATLRASVIGTYATEFATPDSVRFTTGKTDTLANGDAIVHTTLTPTKGKPVTLDYVLKARDGGYQVVNVLAEGVSDLALRASQYDALMKGQGFAALQEKLLAQNKELRSRCK